MIELMKNGIVPFGVTWLRQTYCGLPEIVSIDPLYSVYIPLLAITNSFVTATKLTIFFFYGLSGIAMYYLMYTLGQKRFARLVSSVAYTFTQVLVFEMFQGHLSMVSGFAFIPLVVAFYISAIRKGSPKSVILSGVFLSALAVMRPDFAYFTISFLCLLFLFYLVSLSSRMKTLISTMMIFLIAFLLCYPILEPRYVSKIGELTENTGLYNYQFYSPSLNLPFSPFISSQGAYLGISVLFYSLFGGLISLIHVYKNRRNSSENHVFFLFILALSLIFFLIGLGSSGPLYSVLDRSAPYFSAFRVPTRWFVITVLCLAVLAGKGAIDLLNMIKHENHRRFLKAIALLVVFLDLSVFIAPVVYVQNGWRPVAEYSQDDAVFVSPQASDAPNETMAYEYVSLDETGAFRILSAPIVYSESYYQYARYLRDTNITFAHNYVQFPLRSKLQADVYSGFRYGNFSETVGEQMALLGVKYLVYNYYWGEWEGLVAKMNRSRDLEFVLADNGYILYRNKRFGNVASDNNLILNPSFEARYSAWSPWHVNGGVSSIDTTLSHSGATSMRLTSLSPDEIAGRSQYVYFPESGSPSEFKLSAWCKTENVSGENAYCAVRATIVYDDESVQSAVSAGFSSGTHDWEYSTAYFTSDPQKVVSYVVISFFLRNATGIAWFDNLFLAEERRSDEWSGGFPVKTLYSDANALLSEENRANAGLDVARDSPLTLRLEVNTTEPCYIVVSESFDEGWRISTEDAVTRFGIQNYNGLIAIYVPSAGQYDLSLTFMSYFASLDRIMFFYTATVALVALYCVAWFHQLSVQDLRAATRRLLRQKPSQKTDCTQPCTR